MDSLDPTLIAFAAIGAIAGLGLGVVLGRAGRSRMIAEIKSMRTRVGRMESQSKDQTHSVSRLRKEQGSVASLARSLPGVVNS